MDRTLSVSDEESRTRLCLVGIVNGSAISYELPSTGQVVIGRAPDVEVRIDHPSISRRHAAVHLGSAIELEDLGSSNGTQVREGALARAKRWPITVGESFKVGNIQLVLMARVATPRIRTFWTHGYFEARVAEECARVETVGGSFGVVRVLFDKEPASGDAARAALSSVLGPVDVAGIYSPREYEVLLIQTHDRTPEAVVDRIVGVLAEAKLAAVVGLARYPIDGRDAYSLLAKAQPGASVPRGAVSDLGVGRRMREVIALCERVAKGTINVLVLGETGVGKEVMAERIHRGSPRAPHALLKLNCATLSETLLEAELFGYERGAFTGADRAKPGLLETADKGTVFLDEIGELPLGLQAKLLRVIDERKLLRVGGLRPLDIDVRFVAATNRDLEVESAAGRFRQDLYYRLNGVTLQIPPLRDRVDEIDALVAHFAKLANGGVPHPILPETLELLRRYAWPGNIRELRNIAERAVLLAEGVPIAPEHLPLEKIRATVASVPSVPPAAPRSPISDDVTGVMETTGQRVVPANLRDELSNLERERIEAALRECAGNQSAAAKLLGIPRPTLLKRLDAYGINRPRKK